jgi:serine/threonine-protein kinase SRPK3
MKKKIKKIAKEELKQILQEHINNICIESSEEKEIDDIDNISIVIADFGTIYKKSELENDTEIQTRYYRSPEVILQCWCDEKCDIWSTGCMIYELLTGEILFDPGKDKQHDRDFHHIFWIYETIGPMAEWMKKKCPNRAKYFKKNGDLIVKMPELWNLSDILKESEKDINNPQIGLVKNLIDKMLIIDPKNRLTAIELLQFFRF